MTVWLVMACALAAAVIAMLLLPRLIRQHVARQFGPEGQLCAYHLMTGRQILMLLGEIMPLAARIMSRRDAEWIAAQARAANAWQVRAFATARDPDALAADPTLHALFGKAEPALRQAFADIDLTRHLLEPEGCTRYSPFEPPTGPLRLPAEHQPMRGALLHWPTGYESRWPHHARFVGHLADAGEVHIVVRNSAWARVVLAYLTSNSVPLLRVRVICAPHDDLWVRDCGPTLVSTPNGYAAIVNPYVPNGLGYHRHDSEIPVEVARHWQLPVHRLPLVMEGGNLVPDGEGGLFLCDSVFEHNPDIDERRLAEIMRDWFGIDRLMILPSLRGELTGHADVIVKVAEPGVLLLTEANGAHPWHPALEDAARRIDGWRTAAGKAWQVHRMPMAPSRRGPSEWTYVNALTINGVIVAPAYDPEFDSRAERIFQTVSPNRQVRWIDFRDFPVGATHCQSKEIPA